MASVLDNLSKEESYLVINSTMRKVEAQVKFLSGVIQIKVPEINISKTNLVFEDEKHTAEAKKVCSLIKTVMALKDVVDKFKSLADVLNEISSWLYNNIMEKPAQFLMKKVQIIGLYIKKCMISVQIWIAEKTKGMLVGINNGIGDAIAATLNAAMAALIAVMQALAIAVNAVMMAIKLVLDLLPFIISVGAEQMAFFLTPRSVVMGTMTKGIVPYNPNGSIMNWMPLPIKMAVKNIELATKNANAAIVVSSIAAGAVAGGVVAQAMNKTFEVPNTVCKALQVIDPKKIAKLIGNMLDLIPIPKPLPKYEKLLPTNLGYDAWLITSFCPAGHVMFGFPAFP